MPLFTMTPHLSHYVTKQHPPHSDYAIAGKPREHVKCLRSNTQNIKNVLYVHCQNYVSSNPINLTAFLKKWQP